MWRILCKRGKIRSTSTIYTYTIEHVSREGTNRDFYPFLLHPMLDVYMHVEMDNDDTHAVYMNSASKLVRVKSEFSL